MPHSHFHNLLKEAVHKQVDELGAPVIRGGCSDFAHYRHMTGVIVGLEIALKIAADIEKEDD